MTIRMTMTAVLALALAACGSKPAANDSANAAANDSAVAAPAAPPATNAAAPAAASGTLSKDYMVGKWSALGEDCKDTLEFKADGTVATPIGPGKWTLDGDQLTFDYGDGSKQPASTIKVVSPDRIEISRGSGGKETSRRCP